MLFPTPIGTYSSFYEIVQPPKISIELNWMSKVIYQYWFPRTAVMNYHKPGGLNSRIYSLTILEAKRVKSGCPLGWFVLEPLRENLAQASLPASGDYWPSLSPLGLNNSCLGSVSASTFTWVLPVSLVSSVFKFPSHKNNSRCTKLHPNLVWPFYNLITSARASFQSRVTFTSIRA